MMNIEFEYIEKSSSFGDHILILLHGYGSNEQDLPALAEEIGNDFSYISLRAPLSLPWGGFAWFPIYPAENGFTSDINSALSVIQKLEKCLEQIIAAKQPSSGKVSLLGFSQGSILSQALLFRRPDLLESIIGLSGYMNEDLLPEELPSFENFPAVFLAHGEHDEVIPIDKARKGRSIYLERDIEHTYIEYPMAHSSSPQELEDLRKWWKDHMNKPT